MSEETTSVKAKKSGRAKRSEHAKSKQASVVLCSSFRNSSNYIERYFEQVNTLNKLLTERDDSLSLVLGYGDSTDDTDALLTEQTKSGVKATMVDATHGGKAFGSIVDAERFKQLAYVANTVLASLPDDADVVIWCESDLIWDAETLVKLIDRLKKVSCVAPMIMELSTGGFYDTWAFRRAGMPFEKQSPYHPSLNPFNDDLIRMDSVGSCVAMRADIARRVNLPDEDVIVGMCRQIYEMNESVWLDSSLTVYHA